MNAVLTLPKRILYEKYVDSTGRVWVVGCNMPDRENYIYRQSDLGDRGLDGFPKSFELISGDRVTLIGPNRASKELFEAATGVKL